MNMVLSSENQDQRANRRVGMQISGATANRAVQILGVSVPTLKVIRRTERRCSSASNSTERDFVVLARRAGPDAWPRPEVYYLIIPRCPAQI